MNMNREQIVTALECCASNSLADCDRCPVDEQKKDNCECGRYLAIQALALVRAQREENERLHASCTELTQSCTELETAKAETVREMRRRLKEKLFSVPTVYNAHFSKMVDQIAKEMLEETI